MEIQMNKKILFLFCFLLLTSKTFATQRGIKVTTTTGKDISLYTNYYALVIGNSNYDNWPDLPNARKDAEEIAGMLRELGVEVTLKTNLNSDEMLDALNDFTYQKGNKNERALIFYYAGHGETETLANNKKLGYIIPIDTPLIERNQSEFTKKAISMTEIEDYALRIKSKHVLMLFDSCFSGSIFSLGRAAPKNITEKVAYPVRQFITAGNDDEIVPDESMFKTCIIQGLKKGFADLNNDDYITGKELGSYLQDNVINYTNGAQHPQFGTIRDPELDKGDFVFVMSSKQIEHGTEIESKTSPQVELPETKIFDKKPFSLFPFHKAYPIGLSFSGILELYVIKSDYILLEEHGETGETYNKSFLSTNIYYFISKYLSIGGIFEWDGQEGNTNYNCIIPGFKYFFPKKDKLPFIIGNLSLKNNALDKDQTFEDGGITLNAGVDYYFSKQKVIEPSIYLIYNNHNVDNPQLDHERYNIGIRIFYYNSSSRLIIPSMKYKLIEEFLNTKYFTEYGSFVDKGTFSLTNDIAFSRSGYDFAQVHYKTYSIYLNSYYYLLSNLSFNCGFTASHTKKFDNDFWDSEKICLGFRYFLSFNKVLPFAEIGYEYHSWKPEDTKRKEEHNANATVGLDFFLSENIVVEPFIRHSTFNIGEGSETSHTIEYVLNIKTNFNLFK